MSLLGRRFLATSAVLLYVSLVTLGVSAAPLPDSTWVKLSPPAGASSSALFAVAVDPSNSRSVLVGSANGTIYRSSDAGGTWSGVHTGKAEVTTVSFNPYAAGVALAGTRGGGALVSRNGGVSWSPAAGLEGRTVRVFGFALAMLAAGTDHGVFVSADGARWSQSGLAGQSVDALAVEAIHDPVRLIAAADSRSSAASLPLYQSLDGGATWSSFTPPISGTIAVKLAAGPLPPNRNVRPLLVGTNSGLFISTDGGASFNALSGGGALPTVDYTQASFIGAHYDRFYVASDGGGSRTGGLWRTNDSGRTFATLAPPEPAVTALAVSNDDAPYLYVATFRPSTHAAVLWAYHDTGGPPQGPAFTPPALASGPRATPSPTGTAFGYLLGSAQLPYVALGLGALAILLTAAVAHLRGRRR